MKLPIKTEIPEIETQDFDQDLNNEPPPDALELDESDLKSPETRLAKPNAALCHNSPPHNSIKLFRDVMLDSLQMIAAESPIKFVEDEPQQVPIPITGPTDYECSNAEFEERLKNLRIAMSGSVMDKPASTTLEINTEQVVRKANRVNVDRSTHGGYVEELLILKSLVCQHVEVSKRKEFDLVIERLRNIFNVLTSSAEATKQQPAVDSPQASYTRQATFDMQLQQQVSGTQSSLKKYLSYYVFIITATKGNGRECCRIRGWPKSGCVSRCNDLFLGHIRWRICCNCAAANNRFREAQSIAGNLRSKARLLHDQSGQ